MPLIIAGMHRSGTSLTANFLQQRGLDIGESLWGPGVGNRFGHFEDKEIHRFHEHVLAKNGVLVFPENDAGLPLRLDEEDLAFAGQIVERRPTDRLWGWKEPRTTLFLEFWAEFIPDANFLLLLRNPLAVVDSLVRRGAQKEIVRSPVIGLRAWRIYNERVLSFIRENRERAIVVEIENVIHDPARFCERLDRKFALGLDPVPFDEVYSDREFNAGVPEGLWSLKLLHRSELKCALEVYAKLQAESTQLTSAAV